MGESQVEDVITKVDDFWGKHRLGTRISLISFVMLLVVVVLYPVLAPAKEIVINGVPHLVTKTIPDYSTLLTVVSDTAFWAFAVVTVGANTLGKLAEAWVKVKGK